MKARAPAQVGLAVIVGLAADASGGPARQSVGAMRLASDGAVFCVQLAVEAVSRCTAGPLVHLFDG